MKKQKKPLVTLPEVRILGDLQDIKNLIKAVNKKRSVVVFRDTEQEQHYAEIEGKMQQIPMDLIANLGKEYRFIYFDFSPVRKKTEPAPEPLPEPVTPVKAKPRGRPVKRTGLPKTPAKPRKTKPAAKNKKAEIK
jgi:hypothetical protein